MSTIDTTNPIIAVGRDCGLDATHPLIVASLPFYEQANPLVEEARKINVTDAAEVSLMRRAKEIRLALKRIRVECDKTRKATKEDAQKAVTATDRVFGTIIKAIDAEETRLEEQEKFAERLEAQRKADLRAKRMHALAPYGADMTGLVPEEMSEEAFAELLDHRRAAFERKQEEARRAEEERKERERVEAQERERLRAENARLAAEKAKADAEAAEARRREAEAAKAARDAQAKADRERREREAEEQRRRDEQERARQRAEAAPDAEKITALAEGVRGMPLPVMSSASGKEFAEAARIELGKLADWMLQCRDAMTQ